MDITFILSKSWVDLHYFILQIRRVCLSAFIDHNPVLYLNQLMLTRFLAVQRRLLFVFLNVEIFQDFCKDCVSASMVAFFALRLFFGAVIEDSSFSNSIHVVASCSCCIIFYPSD